jgi:chromosome segregation ATPase
MSDTSSPRSSLDPNLVDTLRREVSAAELQILELKDRMLSVNTDRADAVALLGQAELLLEQKINYIITLDQALNAQIKALEQEIHRKTEEINRRGVRISEIEQRERQECTTHDTIISDLNERLETANQAINQAHEIAREIDQKRAATELGLNQTTARLTATESNLVKTQSSLETQSSSLEESKKQVADLTTQLQDTRSNLSTTAQSLQGQRAEVTQIKSSLLWRLARPWRALFGPKL